MTIRKDDPRLTAYALGEMSTAETKAFEEELARDPSAFSEVDAIRALGRELETELASVPTPILDPDRREALASVTTRATSPRPINAVTVRTVVGVAAVLLLLLGLAVFSVLSQGGGGQGLRVATESAEVPAGAEAPAASPMDMPAFVMDEEDEAGPAPDFWTEGYDRIRENPFVHVADQDHSTFSIDVDTASYANVRRFLQAQGRMPPPGAVRIEEMVNYFSYAYVPPADDAERPFAVHAAVTACPWEPKHRLARIALKGKTMRPETRPQANLVFLLDVSGSMNQANKLPLLKQSMKLLVDQLEPADRVAIAVYAGAAGLVLPSTTADQKTEIVGALDRLEAGGSTNGGAGIELAYRVASEHLVPEGVNRVILCTDGDFNVGVSDRSRLTRLIEEKAQTGVYLSVLGFGTGNYKDARMEELSNKGNGNYAYVDTLREARKVLVEQGSGTLVTIAKDVKIQVFFNPLKVAGWRLIGYENRLLRKEDFHDDTKDAGEIGAGHAVTALYELVPVGVEVPARKGDENPFTRGRGPGHANLSDAVMQVRLRYKEPTASESQMLAYDVFDRGDAFEDSDVDFQWASAVAGFGMMLRDSPNKGQCTWPLVEEIAGAARGRDPDGYRAECLQLIRLASSIDDR